MTGTTENQESSDSAQRKADNHISPVIGPEATTIPKPPPADSENTAPKKKNRWTNDPPMFWVTLAGVIVVVAYTSVAAWQACLTRGQLTVLQGQLDAMIADQRPWVKIEASIAGPLTFFEPAGFAEMPMHFMLTNAGHSPAFNVRLTAWSFLLSLNHHDLEREWGERCENFKRTTLDNPARGMILFPSDQLPWNQSGIGLMPDEIKKNIIDEGGNKALDVWIYGCADYVFGGPQAHHQTGFVYRLGHLISSKGIIALSFRFEPHGTFPTESMTLTSSQSASGQTN